jgi:tetratricopeptide (TPR) repeat protein
LFGAAVGATAATFVMMFVFSNQEVPKAELASTPTTATTTATTTTSATSVQSSVPIDWERVMRDALTQNSAGDVAGAAGTLQKSVDIASAYSRTTTRGMVDARQAYPAPPGALLMLGQLQHSLGLHEASTNSFLAGVALFPPNQIPPEATYSLGVVREAASDYAAAVKWYRQTIHAAPTHQPATANLGLLLAKMSAGAGSNVDHGMGVTADDATGYGARFRQEFTLEDDIVSQRLLA